MNFTEDNFPQKRIKKKKGYQVKIAFENFKLNVFTILDTIINGNDIRIVPNENLLKDCNCLDTKTFFNIELLTTFPDNA